MSKRQKKEDFKALNAEDVLEIYQFFLILEDDLSKIEEKESKHFIQVARLVFEEEFIK